MSALTRKTTHHDEIRQWVEEREGKPGMVSPSDKADVPASLEISFPGESSTATVHEISWEEFFDHFDKEELVFVYKDETAGGERSSFHKIVDRDKMDHFD